MSQLIPPNSSSDPATEAGSAEAVAAATLVAGLAQAFGVDDLTLRSVAVSCRQVQQQAPDIFLPLPVALAPLFNDPRSGETLNLRTACELLAEWGQDAADEPFERLRGDCLRFQVALTAGLQRLHAGQPDEFLERAQAVQRLVFLQAAVITALASQGQGSGVVRTLPTPDHAAFMEQLRSAIEGHRAESKTLGLLVLHVGRVEQVDRQLGLQKGEAFMLRVTRRMREGVLRKQDQLGRISRDQLAVLLPRIAGEGVAILAANKVLAALQPPVPIGDRVFDVDAAIGIVVFPAHGNDPQTLVRNGKLAAGVARDVPDRTAVYDESMGVSEERQSNFDTRLRRALENNALALMFEPQLDTATGSIGGLECSLRWTDDVLGEVSEEEVLATAERAGILREVTWWTFNNAFRQSAEFAKAGLDCKLGLKVMSTALLQPDFPHFVSRALRTWGVPPGRVIIGIDEMAIAGDPGPVKQALAELKSFGLRLSVDRFGSAASSLMNLSQLPIDELRLAGVVVAESGRSESKGRLVRALFRLARDLGFKVTAEGVSDGATAVALTGMGCERVQGMHVSPPLSAEDILAFERSGTGLTKLRLSDL